LFTRVRVFGGKSDTLQSGVQILVEGDKIASIDTTHNPLPSGATVVDCADRATGTANPPVRRAFSASDDFKAAAS
jgi:hypothetical protein